MSNEEYLDSKLNTVEKYGIIEERSTHLSESYPRVDDYLLYKFFQRYTLLSVETGLDLTEDIVV